MTTWQRILLWGGSAIGLVGLLWVLTYFGTKGTTTTTVDLTTPVSADDHSSGSLTAPAVLVEYSDFECPACGAYYPMIKALQEKYGEKFTLVYRHYPLRTIHASADISARASEAAHNQQKFWEYYELLFTRQEAWTKASDVRQTLIDYAKELGLNETQFAADLDSQAVKDRVQRDVNSGNAVRVPGTPTFFLNGKSITTPQNQAAFEALIDQEINS